MLCTADSGENTHWISGFCRELGVSIILRMDYSPSFLENLTFLELEEVDLNVEPAFLRLKDEPVTKAAMQFGGIVE